jgi:hypothetical protein
MSKSEPWLLLMHQLPPKPDSLRVRIWRTLQKIGALQLKNSVYVLPAGKANQEKFESVVEEIVSGKGDAFLCRSDFVLGINTDELVEEFNSDRSERYKLLANELRPLQKILANQKLSEDDLMGVEHSIGKLDRQLKEVKAIDFFACKDQGSAFKQLNSLLSRVEDLRAGAGKHIAKMNRDSYQGKVWVTRKDIHVDRLASAWLIATYIDRKPKFKFVGETNYKPSKNEIRFDMFEGEFTHVGDKCTFEVLVESFSLSEKSVNAIAEIIHDLDLKDTKFNRPETSGIGMVLQGIVKSELSDDGRIKKASSMFADLNKSFQTQFKIRRRMKK